MAKIVLSKLVSRETSSLWSRAQLNEGKCFRISSKLSTVVSWEGSFDLGHQVSLAWTGKIFCTSCNAPAKKLINGYCFQCMQTRAEADSCVMSPHLCHYLSGTCREPEWGLSFCYKPHLLYLSYTGDFKVGITRESQIPTRWFDQGATWAMPLALVGSRNQAGAIEKALSSQISDRTVWQKMLKSGNGQPTEQAVAEVVGQINGLRSNLNLADPLKTRVSAPPRAPSAGLIEWFESPSSFELTYAAQSIQELPPTLSFEKQAEISGVLLGIKGQYLLFEQGVFNVRRHEGYEVILA